MLSFSPRPFSAASVVATPKGKVFVKRHHCSVRDLNGLLEEHRLIAHLAAVDEVGGSKRLVAPVLADCDGKTAIADREWTYEVQPVAQGLDVYEDAVSWTPFLCGGHARSAGQALARLHQAAVGYDAQARKTQQLVSTFTIFADRSPMERMEIYMESRPRLRDYAEQRNWRASFDEVLMPLQARLEPWLPDLKPLWTHNDLHASNLMWSGAGEDAEVLSVIDFGLANRTNAVHDIATAIERNIVEWLRMDEAGAEIVHIDHLDALLAGYEEISPLSYEEAQALVAMLPLVHCEFALSETDYFLRILESPEKAYLAYEGYFLAHARWFQTAQGRRLLEYLEAWVKQRSGARGGER